MDFITLVIVHIIKGFMLTLKCIRYFSLPFVHKGEGSTWTHSFLSTLPQEFLHGNGNMCVYTQNNHISAKNKQTNKQKQKNFRFKMAANKIIFVTREKSRDQSLKNHFPKRNFSIKFSSKLKNMNTFTFLK